MIEAGVALDNQSFVEVGLETLTWLSQQQTAVGGHFRPIGSQSFGTDHGCRPFDQQPLEAQAAIEASHAAYLATGQAQWREHAEAAWRWFFGANDRGVVLGDLDSGRCFDGINPRGVNQNCGAESVLAFQLAYCSLRALGRAQGSKSNGTYR
jgi:hypothetical protein